MTEGTRYLLFAGRPKNLTGGVGTLLAYATEDGYQAMLDELQLDAIGRWTYHPSSWTNPLILNWWNILDVQTMTIVAGCELRTQTIRFLRRFQPRPIN